MKRTRAKAQCHKVFVWGPARISNSPSPIRNREHPCALSVIDNCDFKTDVRLTEFLIPMRLTVPNAQGCSRLRIGDGESLIRAGSIQKPCGIRHKARAYRHITAGHMSYDATPFEKDEERYRKQQ